MDILHKLQSCALHSFTHTHTHRLYSDDAAKTNKGVRPASFCIELRDKSGYYGFVLPAEQVRQQYHTGTLRFLAWLLNLIKYHNIDA